MSEEQVETKNFFQLLVDWIATLPIDIKILVEMIGDEQLDITARTLAVGTLLYIISPLDIIPEKVGRVVGYIDDVIILRIALAAIVEIDPSRAKYYQEKYPDFLAGLDQHIKLLKDTLGALYGWLKALVDKLFKRTFHGKTTEDVAKSAEVQEDLFDEAMEYAANVPVDKEFIEQKLLETPPRQILELLSNGLEDGQKYQAKVEEHSQRKTITASREIFRKMLGRGGTE